MLIHEEPILFLTSYFYYQNVMRVFITFESCVITVKTDLCYYIVCVLLDSILLRVVNVS